MLPKFLKKFHNLHLWKIPLNSKNLTLKQTPKQSLSKRKAFLFLQCEVGGLNSKIILKTFKRGLKKRKIKLIVLMMNNLSKNIERVYKLNLIPQKMPMLLCFQSSTISQVHSQKKKRVSLTQVREW